MAGGLYCVAWFSLVLSCLSEKCKLLAYTICENTVGPNIKMYRSINNNCHRINSIYNIVNLTYRLDCVTLVDRNRQVELSGAADDVQE